MQGNSRRCPICISHFIMKWFPASRNEWHSNLEVLRTMPKAYHFSMGARSNKAACLFINISLHWYTGRSTIWLSLPTCDASPKQSHYWINLYSFLWFSPWFIFTLHPLWDWDMTFLSQFFKADSDVASGIWRPLLPFWVVEWVVEDMSLRWASFATSMVARLRRPG